jgi:hypothetical protein
MCGNEAIIIDEHDSDNNEKKQQEVEAPNIIIEQIDGTLLTRLIAVDIEKIQCCIWKQLCR